MDSNKLRYDKRGVSATKDEVHAAIKHLDKGLFPNAFCKVIPDISGGDPAYCNIMHADTAGSKTSLAYLYWKETGDLSVWKGIAEDAMVMNLDDMACIGCLNNIVLSSTIGRNKSLIPGEVISVIISHTQAFLEKMEKHGISIVSAGGETADVGDIVRTIDVGYTAFARMKRSDVVDINIRPGDLIVGFSSSGRSVYEDAYNGGMGSNGLTSARHDVFSHHYATRYPESYSPEIPESVVYCGTRNLTDEVKINNDSITVGKLVLSPTRTYMPVLRPVIDCFRKNIHGIIHCSGGGQTKVSKFMPPDVCIVKDNLFEIPPLFTLIQEESGLGMREMFQVFNMGHRLEIYLPDRSAAEEIISVSHSFGVDAKIIGEVRPAEKAAIEIRHEGKTVTYSF